jgi:glyoxylate reductase
MSKKVLVTLDIPEKGLNLLREAGFELTVGDSANPFSYEELIKLTADFDYIIPSSKDKIDRNFLEANKHLKVISTFSAGYDHIDIQAATELGIPVGHTPEAMNRATSDIAFGLMISVSRNFFQLHKKIEAGNWGGFRPRADLGQELYGKTLGVFGLGAIGFEMARKCRAAFNMEIHYCNRSVNSRAEKELNAVKVSFEDLLHKSDVISVHSNLSDETTYRFNSNAFSKMKPSAIFVNTSRGKVHHEPDLITALKEGKIWGAGLDVTDPEPMNSDNPLLQMPNVCVLPHIGSATVEARDEMARLSAVNLIQYLEKGTMIYCVNPEVLS